MKKEKQTNSNHSTEDKKLPVERFDEIEKERIKADEAFDRLRNSLMLELADPEAFKYGSAFVSYKSSPPHRWPQDFEMNIRRGDDTVLTKKLINYSDAPWLASLKPAGAKEGGVK